MSGNFTPRPSYSQEGIPLLQEVGWALWFFFRSLAPTDTRTPDSPGRSLDAIPTTRWRQQRQVNKSGRPNLLTYSMEQSPS